MNWQPILDHLAQAKERLFEQYKNKAKLGYLIEGLLIEIQTLEDVYNTLGTERGIRDAVGAQLDLIGEIVGLPRPPGTNDTDYLFLLRTKIIQNLNEGTPEEFIAAAKFFTGLTDFFYSEVYPAAVDYYVYTPLDPAEALIIKNRLQRFLPVTVSLDAFGFIPATPFLFDMGFGFGNTAETTGDLLSTVY